MRACVSMMCVSITILMLAAAYWVALCIHDYKPYPACTIERKAK